MNRKSKIIAGAAAAVAAAGIASFFAVRGAKPAGEELPMPAIGEVAVLDIMNRRTSVREFSSKEIDRQTLAEILWAAFGKNSHGTRTIPTANNKKDLGVYAITPSGAWAYDGEEGRIIQRSAEDLRKLFAKQDFVLDAPLTILYTGTRPEYSGIHAGQSMQNVALYVTAKGLGAVTRAYFEAEALKPALKLGEKETPIISITIGWPK
ncbi:MAG: nitroreductase family protein [Rickettsiales bacterium]|jgi:nitroreductase|nr:nitroreductase family protein [Rickettsiales bacterium]